MSFSDGIEQEGSRRSPSVSLVRCESYQYELVEEAVRTAISMLGGMESFIKKGEKVLLKVNLLAGVSPEKAVTTHPSVTKAMAVLILEAGGIPVIGDSAPVLGSPEKGFRIAGFSEVAGELGIELLTLKSEKTFKFPQMRYGREFVLSGELDEVDHIMSVAKLKSHGLTSLTGVIKNLFGVVPGRNKATYHFTMQDTRIFSETLVDLFLLLNPILCVMDGVVGMEGKGPRSGNPREVGAILASRDGFALDAIAAALVKQEYARLPVLSEARQRGLLPERLDEIRVLGNTLSEMAIDGFQVPKSDARYGYNSRLPRWASRWAKNRLTARPVIRTELCTACEGCLKTCPIGAIDRCEDKIIIDEKSCIRCYCCDEACPQGAIKLEKGWLQRVIEGRGPQSRDEPSITV